MLSLGFYQFTSHALNGESKAGASKVNEFLPKNVQIPGSVISLRGRDHHRAAYLFSIHNLAILAKSLNKKQIANLKKALKSKPGDIVTFIATSHHAPSDARVSMRAWLKKDLKGNLNDHLKGRLVLYGKKSDSNLAALENYYS
jgi:hypothetical protein